MSAGDALADISGAAIFDGYRYVDSPSLLGRGQERVTGDGANAFGKFLLFLR